MATVTEQARAKASVTVMAPATAQEKDPKAKAMD
jgi:hypothetical protein